MRRSGGILAPLLLLGCGARSQLYAAGAPHGSDPTNDDPCPSAVSGPKAMAGSCSTRDARARVAAPSAPHVTWTTKLPTDASGMLGQAAVATDASGHAFVVATADADTSPNVLSRVRTADGVVEWSASITPVSETSTPIVLAGGGVDLMGSDPGFLDAVLTYDAATGAATASTFGLSLYDAPPDLAVGADGSLYVCHLDNVGQAHQETYVSRISPSGEVLWTSPDLATLGPPPMFDGEVFPAVLALGEGDLVVAMDSVIAEAGDFAVVSAFEPATGAVRWSTALAGSPSGGPVIRADGTIAVLVYLPGPATNAGLVTLDPATGAATTSPIAIGTSGLGGATLDGAVLTGANAGNGITSLVALEGDGTIRWTAPGHGGATIAADGTVISFGEPITAIDGATGATKWTLSPPGPCLSDLALTSDGGLVGLLCDGTLFGASD